MSTRTDDERFVFPEVALDPNTLIEDFANRVWTDEDNPGDIDTSLEIGTNTFVVENATIVVGGLRKTGQADTDAGYDIRNATVIFSDQTAQTEGNLGGGNQLGGTNLFRNVSFIRDGSALPDLTNATRGQRLIIGNPTNNNGNSEFDNCSFQSIDERNPLLFLNNGFTTLMFTANSLIGAVAGQWTHGFISERTTWASTGGNDGGVGQFNGDQYFARCIHTDLATGNNMPGTLSTNRLPNDGAVFFLDDDMSGPVALDTHLQLNANAAAILVNCTTGLNSPDLPISFHQGDPINAANPAGVYHMVGWKPEWMDITAEVPVRDVRISFGNEAYLVPEYTDDATFLQALETNRIVTNTVVAFDPLNPNFRGYWIESARMTYDDTTATPVDFVGPANALYTARSYTHILQDVNLTGVRNREFTNALGQTDFKNGDVTNGVDNFTSNPIGVFADADLNGVAYADANGVITNTDEVYSRVKREWYDSDPFAVLGVTNNNGVLTFDRGTIFNPNVRRYAERTIRLNETFTGDTISPSTLVNGFAITDTTNINQVQQTFERAPGLLQNPPVTVILDAQVQNVRDITRVQGRIPGGNLFGAPVNPTNYTYNRATGELTINQPYGDTIDPWILEVDYRHFPAIDYNGNTLNGVTLGEGVHTNFNPATLNITTTADTQLEFNGDLVPRNADGFRILDATQWVINGVAPTTEPVTTRDDGGDFIPFTVELFQNTADALGVADNRNVLPSPNIIYNILTASHTITAQDVLDTNGISVGGYFAVLQFDGTNWTQVGTTEDVAPGSSVTPVRIVEGGDYIAIWRPKDLTYSTTIHEFTSDLTTTDITVPAMEITSTLLFNPLTTTLPTIDPWAIDWTILGTELLGTITGTSDSSIPDQAQTQLLLMQATLDIDYVTVMINYMIANDAIARDVRDYIFPLSPSVTAIDGEFVQLDTGSGQQQVLSSVVGRDANGNDTTGALANMISAQITGTEDGTSDTISFPAVRFVPNAAGISGADVLSAFNTAITELERGVGYTVNTLDANPIIQAPTGTTYDNTGNTEYPL